MDRTANRNGGELQLADYGISGIPVFQVSSPASKALYQKKQAELTINFLPDFSEDMLAQELQRRFSTGCRDTGCRRITSWAFKP